jgi:4-hydroxybenzoate polyprenyltransferase
MPTVTINVSDTAAAQAAVANFQAQTLWIRLAVTLPLGILGAIWKSYLGGLGTNYGTGGRSSLAKSFAVFFGLALLGMLINFLINPNSI